MSPHKSKKTQTNSTLFWVLSVANFFTFRFAVCFCSVLLLALFGDANFKVGTFGLWLGGWNPKGKPCASVGICGCARHAPRPQRGEERKLKGTLKIHHRKRFFLPVRGNFPWDSHGCCRPFVKASFTKNKTVFVTTPHSWFHQWGRKVFCQQSDPVVGFPGDDGPSTRDASGGANRLARRLYENPLRRAKERIYKCRRSVS